MLLLTRAPLLLAVLTALAPAQVDAGPQGDPYEKMVTEYETAVRTFEKKRNEALATGGVEAVQLLERQHPRRQFLPLFKAGANKHRKQAAAIPYLTWLLTAVPRPSNPTAKSALAVLLRDHLAHPEVEPAIACLDRAHSFVGTPWALTMLQRVQQQAQIPAVRGAAMFARSAIKLQERDLTDEERAEAVTWLTDAIEAAPDAGFTAKARGMLFEIERLQVGMPAPEIDGVDLDGIPFKLSDYRGKVVVLVFWISNWGPCLGQFAHGNHLMSIRVNQPLTMLGVNGDADRDAIRQYVLEHDLAIRSFWDGAGRPIATQWNVHGWPKVYAVDHEGIIRFRGENIDLKRIGHLLSAASRANDRVPLIQETRRT